MMLPQTRFDVLLHWGCLDSAPANRGTSTSHEGCLLSCSHDEEVADAWREIARLGGTELWHLSQPRGFNLVDVHKLSRGQQTAFLTQGVAEGLLTVGEAYKASHYDSEADERVYSLFDTKGEARRESADQPALRIHRLRVHRATPKLVSYWQSRHGRTSISLHFTFDAAAAFLIDNHHPEIDGLFWNDDFDPAALSAPRVGLFQRVVKTCRKTVV